MVPIGRALGLLVLGGRAGLASATFMAPGGDILGWSRLPSARCALCHVALPARASSRQDQHAWTPATYAGVLLQRLSLDDELGQMQMVQFGGLPPPPEAFPMFNAQGAG